MKTFRFLFILVALASADAAEQKVTKFARFQLDKTAACGVVEGETIHEISGNLYGECKRTHRHAPRRVRGGDPRHRRPAEQVTATP